MSRQTIRQAEQAWVDVKAAGTPTLPQVRATVDDLWAAILELNRTRDRTSWKRPDPP